MDDYKAYERGVLGKKERGIRHLLSVYDVCLKFVLSSDVKRMIGADDRFWQQAPGLGNIPDCWIQFAGGEAFIEVDLGSESRSVIAAKFEHYLNFAKSGGYADLFPRCEFKVLFVTTTEERIETLEEIAKSDAIWFATMDEFLQEPLDHEHWFAIRGFYALPAIR
jgi:hypothetical protein